MLVATARNSLLGARRMPRQIAIAASLLLLSALLLIAEEPKSGEPFPGTKPLTATGDLAAQMVAGVDKFLLRELDQSVAQREKHWKRDFSSAEAYEKSIEPNRKRLAHILGVRDERVKFTAPELVATTQQSALVGKGEKYDIYAVRWPVVREVRGEGLLLVPKGDVVADIIAIPDCEQTPEQICGLADGVPPESQFARRLAESGCRVLVPTLINREMKQRHPPERQGGANVSNREFLYRPAFELGRHLIGYEVQKVLAGVDWFTAEAGKKDAKIGVIGYGEGGMLANYAGALDTRIDVIGISGFFGGLQNVWQEPIDRNVFGIVEEFGDEGLASLTVPRAVVIEASSTPRVKLPSEGGAPAVLGGDEFDEKATLAFHATMNKAQRQLPESIPHRHGFMVGSGPAGPERVRRFGSGSFVLQLLTAIDAPRLSTEPQSRPVQVLSKLDAAARHQRQFDEINEDTQKLLTESPYVRNAFMKKLYDSKNLDEYNKSVEEYREIFAKDVIGRFDQPLLEANPRSRKTYDNEKWTGYEVMLDVFPDVFAYGVLLVPKDLKDGEKRPVIVCQHGLEGKPTDVFLGDHYAYHDFAAKLAERGFITFAPQNIYIGKDLFRTLQRKANPLGKTLFSVMVPQHQQICNWLSSLPMVDKDRIAFYGLSYGGKSAMRIPPLVKNYCLSICSADFNEWVAKNASTRLPFSYVWTGEYEIFEFDLGSTFNYAEMAALIAPRPFMVERGHTDGVSQDEWVAFEYAKVFNLYSHRLKLADRCEMEVFDGPHTINGKGTYDFLHKHLNWAKR